MSQATVSELTPEVVIARTTATEMLAEHLAHQTNLSMVEGDAIGAAPFCLLWLDGRLLLRDKSTRQPADICVDFVQGRHRHRRQFGGGFGQPLARAMNIKPDDCPSVCDATGGLGGDAFVFATLGCQVLLLERSAIVFALLQDGLRRARECSDTRDIAQRMTACHLDSRDLPACWSRPDKPTTVYLDPMYPDNKKRAAAKKGMQILQRVLPRGIDDQNDEADLLTAAIATARSRVVVKRPLRAPPLPGHRRVGDIRSPNTRYDLYRGQG